MARSAAGSAAAPGGRTAPGTVTQTVNWTGHVDLTKNPLIGTPIPGWPHGAFASDITTTAFFAPLGKILMDPTVTPPPTGSGHGGQQKSVGGWIGRGLCWGVGGVIGAAGTMSEAIPNPFGLMIAGAAGAGASVCSDWVSEWDSEVPDSQPPNPDIPTDPGPTGPSTQTQPDDPPPPPDGGGGGKPDQDNKQQHEEN
jgi:hypothetical protein